MRKIPFYSWLFDIIFRTVFNFCTRQNEDPDKESSTQPPASAHHNAHPNARQKAKHGNKQQQHYQQQQREDLTNDMIGDDLYLRLKDFIKEFSSELLEVLDHLRSLKILKFTHI